MSKQNRERRRAIRGRQVDAAVARMRRLHEDDRCLLCGGTATIVGFFFPNPAMSRRLLVAPGKERVYGYRLCGPCKSAPDAMARVEAAIVADFERGAAGVCTN